MNMQALFQPGCDDTLVLRIGWRVTKRIQRLLQTSATGLLLNFEEHFHQGLWTRQLGADGCRIAAARVIHPEIFPKDSQQVPPSKSGSTGHLVEIVNQRKSNRPGRGSLRRFGFIPISKENPWNDQNGLVICN